MECGLYLFLLSFSFFLLDLYLFLKYEGMRPVKSEVQKKAVELGVDIVVFPGLVLTAGIARILSEVYTSVLPFALGVLVATFVATVIFVRFKNQSEKFVRLTEKIAKNSGKVVAFNLLVLSVFTFSFLKALCGVVEMGTLSSIMIPLVLYALLSRRYLKIVKQTLLGGG